MKSFQIFLIAVVVLAAAVYFTAGRANRPKGVSAMKLEALADAAEKGNPEAALEAAVRYGFGIRGGEGGLERGLCLGLSGREGRK